MIYNVNQNKNQFKMPIKSYLVHPIEGKIEELLSDLNNLDQCEVVSAKNQDILALVTDTPNDIEEELLKEKIEALDSLKILSLVSGYNTTQN